MVKVFVHGNPETDAVWEPLIAALAERGVADIRLLSPPGFGAPVPAGFGCTRTDYRDWLIGELEALGQPVDLVGHDWGAGHVFGVAAARPDLLRSWAADCAGLLHPDYVWHAGAQTWQTPGAGEEFAAAMVGLAPEALTAWGVAEALAPALAAGIDEAMVAAMLTLYRSAAQPALRQVGEALLAAERRPALVIEATGDPYVGADLSAQMVPLLDADVVHLDAGHWWMWEQTDQAADALVSFWSSRWCRKSRQPRQPAASPTFSTPSSTTGRATR